MGRDNQALSGAECIADYPVQTQGAQMLLRQPATAAALAATLLLLTGGHQAAGQDNGSASAVAPPAGTLDLRRVTVTATRNEDPALAAPATVNTLEREELGVRRQARSLPEALGEVPGIMVQKTAHGQGSPFIRGFTGFRTLLLIDGIRLNNSTYREGPNQYWNTIDPLSLERIEVVKGPGSVLFGSDAIGGTANAITISPVTRAPEAGWGGGLYYRYSGAENASIARPWFAWNGGALAVGGGVSIKDFGDLEGGRDVGTQPNTGYEETDADLRLEYAPDTDARWILGLQRVSQQDAWRTHRTIFGVPWEGTDIGNELRRSLDQDRALAYLQYHAQPGGPIDALKVSLSHHIQEEQRLRVRSDQRSDVQGTDVATRGLWAQFTTLAERGRWDYGFEYYHDDVDSFRTDFNADGSLRGERIQGPVADDATYGLFGLFAQRTLPGAHLDWTLGVHYTRARADADKVEDPLSGQQTTLDDSWDAAVGSARVVYRTHDQSPWRLFASLAQGFRAPNLSDLTRLDTARSNEIETPVSGLDAEDFVNLELGYKVSTDTVDAQLAWYYTDIANMIVRTPTGRLIEEANEVTKANAGDGWVSGFEAEWRLKLSPALSVLGGFTWMDGEVDTFPTSAPVAVTEPIDRLMPATLHAGLRWTPPARSYWIEALVTRADSQRNLSTRDRSDTQRIPPGGTPGYTILNLRSAWAVAPGLRLSAAVENLLDEDYRVHGSGVNAPGRNLLITFDWHR